MEFISDDVSQYCKHEISNKLHEVIPQNTNIEEITNFVWFRILQPNTSKESVIAELHSILGNYCNDFVDWILESLTEYVQGIKPVPFNYKHSIMQNKDELLNQNAILTMSYTDESHGTSNSEKTQSVSFYNDEKQKKFNDHTEKIASQPQTAQNNYRTNKREFRSNSTSTSMIGVSHAGRRVTSARELNAAKIKKKCPNFPNCVDGDSCTFVHPEEMCKFWPHCPFGSTCFYIHPDIKCKYGINCPHVNCNYVHPKDWNAKLVAGKYNLNTGTFRNSTYTPKE